MTARPRDEQIDRVLEAFQPYWTGKPGRFDCPICSNDTLDVHTHGAKHPVVINCHYGCEVGEIIREVGLCWCDIQAGGRCPAYCPKATHSRDVPPEMYLQNAPQDDALEFETRADGSEIDSGGNVLARLDWDDLKQAANSGALERVDVLGEPGDDVQNNARVAAHHIRELFALAYGAGDYRPIPVSTRFLARRIGWPQSIAASSIRQLIRYGYVVDAGELKARGYPRGTRLLAPPPAKNARVVELAEAGVHVKAGATARLDIGAERLPREPVEERTVAVEVPAVKPRREAHEQPLGLLDLSASRRLHNTNPTPPLGY